MLTRSCCVSLAAFVAGSALLRPPTAAAQECSQACPVRLRDARGCCPGSGPPPPPPPTSTATPPPPPPPPTTQCPTGQEVGPDTAGHCCWSGQAWSGSRCVGTPGFCPEGYAVDVGAQECRLQACTSGLTRSSDGVHCCWPGQAWSKTRLACVGTPQCPRGFEPAGESCVSVDKDGDGVLNAADGCPDRAEDPDKFQDADGCPDDDNDADGVPDASDRCGSDQEDQNGFEDGDGCPDEPDRLRAAAKVERAAQGRERSAAAQAAEDARKAEAQARHAEWEAETADNADSRVTGYFLIGGGVLGGALTGMFLGIGANNNDTIQSGGFATAADIEQAESDGTAFNVLSVVFGIAGGGLVAAGLPVVLFNLDPEEPSTSAVRAPATGSRDSWSGAF